MNKRTALFIFIFFFTVFIIGCGKTDTYNGVSNEIKKDAIALGEINYDDIPWDEKVGDFTDNLNISEETAMKIVELLIQDYDPSYLKDKKAILKTVKDRSIYVIYYLMDPPQPGGGFSIVFDSKTGKVLKMWASE